MHPKEEILRAYLDQELPLEGVQETSSHLKTCMECQAKLDALVSRSGRVGAHLSVLEPTPEEAPSPAMAAYARLSKHLSLQKEQNMIEKLLSRRMRPALTGITLIVILILTLAIPSVRAAAVNFLGLFRVQQIEVVEFNPANLPSDLENRSQDIERILSEDVTFSDNGEAFEVADAAEASELAGFDVILPEGVAGKQRLTYQPEASATFTVNLALWQGILNDIGRSDIQLPEALDGQTITFNFPNSVTFAAGTCALEPEAVKETPSRLRNCTTFIQMPSPTIQAPPGLPIDQIGEAFLQIFGMSAAEAASFSQRVDWSTTLVIPVPPGAEYSEINVQGVSGTLFENRVYREGASASQFMLMWIKGDILYALSGPGSQAEALVLVNSLK